MMDPKDHKPELNAGNNWEQDLESVRSALSGLESVEPPDLLDQAILNTARRELTASRPRPMRWVGAFATAAVVILKRPISAVGMALNWMLPGRPQPAKRTLWALQQCPKSSSHHHNLPLH